MKLAQTILNSKSIIAGIIAAVLIVGLSGCGNPERKAARQKFKEAIAAIKVRTQDSTYPEFRQAELDLETSYEANKTYLADVSNQFANLDALVKATDYFWSKNIQYPNVPIYIGNKTDLEEIQVISPEANIMEKIKLPAAQTKGDPDFFPKNYVPRGLAKINDQAEVLLNLLEK